MYLHFVFNWIKLLYINYYTLAFILFLYNISLAYIYYCAIFRFIFNCLWFFLFTSPTISCFPINAFIFVSTNNWMHILMPHTHTHTLTNTYVCTYMGPLSCLQHLPNSSFACCPPVPLPSPPAPLVPVLVSSIAANTDDRIWLPCCCRRCCRCLLLSAL